MKILLVEDNEELAENLAEIFVDEGHEVAFAANGREALLAAREPFDLALLDVRLPDALGTALLPQLKEMVPSSEVIVSTGNADLQSAIEALRGGAFAYLTKPVGVEELILTTRRALERVQLRRLSESLRAELEESERRHRDIVEAVQAMIVALGRDYKIRFANRQAEELSGWPREELVGRDYFEVFAPQSQRDARRARVRAAFDGFNPELEVDIVTRTGAVRRVQMRWTRQASGGEDLIYGMGLDVTRQRELERKARTSEKLAAVGTLAAGLAHEIRNPLNAAGLQLSLLSRRIGKLPEHERSNLEQPLELVRAELSRLNSLLGDFLAFARPREYTRYPIDLSALVGRVVEFDGQSALQGGKKLASSIEPGVAVLGDADALHQVFVNLLKNGLEAATTQVDVHLVVEDGRAVLTFRDDGPGIPRDVLARLFEPFFTTKPQGTGLGLAIVHTIVTAHGGEVGISAPAEGGTVARVSLPVAQQALPAAAP
ncbi:ATP-binding protein [Vulgatibacter sp.]|uniref:hybrid sensor histidine kinase/response regulator n=1 Tax=Vulgatibacter sp. TaxID=1971226 RepID=UPI003563A3AB